MINIYNSKNDGHWSVEKKSVHLFLDRCEDVKYICKSMILFKRYEQKKNAIDLIFNTKLYVNKMQTIFRLNNGHPIPKPKFSFTKGLEFEKVMESIELRFDKSINNLENIQNVIFNVNTTDWYQYELEYDFNYAPYNWFPVKIINRSLI